MENNYDIIAFTDGACKGNPGPGGWGALLVSGSEQNEYFGGEENTTNNRMELSAVIHAVEVIKKPEEVDLIIRTDSQLAVNQFPGKWKVNDNIDLVLRGRELLNRFKSYRFEWVKGHASNPFNNECDQMAVAAIKKKKGDITVEVLNE
jgi:ribonuclease HI